MFRSGFRLKYSKVIEDEIRRSEFWATEFIYWLQCSRGNADPNKISLGWNLKHNLNRKSSRHYSRQEIVITVSFEWLFSAIVTFPITLTVKWCRKNYLKHFDLSKVMCILVNRSIALQNLASNEASIFKIALFPIFHAVFPMRLNFWGLGILGKR